MKCNLKRIVLLFFLPFINTFGLQADNSVDLEPELMSSFLNQYCVECHGEKKQKADLRLDTLSRKIDNNDIAQHWQEVLDALNVNDMPPEDEQQPSQEELELVLEHLTDSLITAKKRLTEIGGEVALRKLNRREYRNTIDQLFGYRILEDSLPENSETDTYDTVGYEQYFSAYDFERYFEFNQDIIKAALKFVAAPHEEVKYQKHEPEVNNKRLQAYIDDYDKKMKRIEQGATHEDLGIVDAKQLKMFVKRYDGRAGKRKRYLEQPLTPEGVYLDHDVVRKIGMRTNADPRATYKLKIHAGFADASHPLRHFLDVKQNGHRIGVLRVRGTFENPGIVEIELRPIFNENSLSVEIEENKPGKVKIDKYIRGLGDKISSKSSIFIEHIGIEGPFYKGESLFESLYKSLLNRKARLAEDDFARQLFHEFSVLAFRHLQPKASYVDHLMRIYHDHRKQKKSFKEALVDPLALILSSPSFLYLSEAINEMNMISDFELANRLSTFLWSRSPDQSLRNAASRLQLKKSEVLKSETERMIAHTNVKALVEGFFSQWSLLKRFDEVPIDQNKHIQFNDGVRYSAKKEALAFFETLLKENLSIGNLIDSDFVMVNNMMSTHYGLNVQLPDANFHKVDLDASSPRGGMIGQTAFLSMGSNGERSSPIIRGALVMEKFLHQTPPPPPANVPELEQASKKALSVREIVDLHREKAQCGSCHRKMDPIGFGLENFDLLGLWRDVEKVGKKQQKIISDGHFPNKSKFSNLEEFKQGLSTQQDKLAGAILEGMMEYALGRRVEFSDQLYIDEILNESKKQNYRTKDLIINLISHPIFMKL